MKGRRRQWTDSRRFNRVSGLGSFVVDLTVGSLTGWDPWTTIWDGVDSGRTPEGERGPYVSVLLSSFEEGLFLFRRTFQSICVPVSFEREGGRVSV